MSQLLSRNNTFVDKKSNEDQYDNSMKRLHEKRIGTLSKKTKNGKEVSHLKKKFMSNESRCFRQIS